MLNGISILSSEEEKEQENYTSENVTVDTVAVNMSDDIAVKGINPKSPTIIKIVGCGGGGSSTVKRLIESNTKFVDFFVMNTDLQALASSPAPDQNKLAIGQKITGGLGAGGNPEIGEKAAKEDSEMIKKALTGANMVILTAGMGGGTGTGSVPIVADIARKLGALTVAVVTTPFSFEGYARKEHAEQGLKKLKECVDSLIVIPNEQIFKLTNEDLDMKQSFRLADQLLCDIVRGMTDIIIKEGEPNLDFNDMKTVLLNQGNALLGVGYGDGENRAVDAAQSSISNPLLEGIKIDGAKNVLINITSGTDWTLRETQELVSTVTASANKRCNVFLGNVTDASMGSKVNVIVIATGFDSEEPAEEAPAEPVVEKDPNVVDSNEFSSILNGIPSHKPIKNDSKYDMFGTFESPKNENKSSLGIDLFDSANRPATSASPLKRPANYNGPNDESMPACWRNQGTLSRTISFRDDE